MKTYVYLASLLLFLTCGKKSAASTIVNYQIDEGTIYMTDNTGAHVVTTGSCSQNYNIPALDGAITYNNLGFFFFPAPPTYSNYWAVFVNGGAGWASVSISPYGPLSVTDLVNYSEMAAFCGVAPAAPGWQTAYSFIDGDVEQFAYNDGDYREVGDTQVDYEVQVNVDFLVPDKASPLINLSLLWPALFRTWKRGMLERSLLSAPMPRLVNDTQRIFARVTH